MLTIGGDIELNRRYFWSKVGGGVYPVDAWIGITLSKASPAAREACSTMGVVQDFAHARTWGVGEEAKAWASKQLHDIKHLGGRPVLAAIDEAKKKLRAPAKQNALRLLRNYIVERWEMVEYPAALAKGWDIGSGPTQAMCKNLTLRLKRPGMKWDTDNAAALMNLVALREGGQWEQYRQTRKIA